jgi:hypothetical protein
LSRFKRVQVDPPISESNTDVQSCFSGEVPLSDKPILLILSLVLQTAFLKSCRKPISLLLLGKPGIGKSRLLSPLAQLDYVSYVNDITPKYLVEFLHKAKTHEKKFLVVPDFTNCMSHGKNTRTTLVAILRSMTEEGVVDLSDYHLEFKSTTPVKAGLITAVTNSSYNEFREAWKNTGFLSRLLPFSFSHSAETLARIMDDIDAKRPDAIEMFKFQAKKTPSNVSTPEYLLRQLRAYEELLSKSTGSLPYRHQIQLNAITEAFAVIQNEAEVTQEHIDAISWLLKWINYDFKEM